MTSHIRVGRGSKIAPKKERFRVGQDRQVKNGQKTRDVFIKPYFKENSIEIRYKRNYFRQISSSFSRILLLSTQTYESTIFLSRNFGYSKTYNVKKKTIWSPFVATEFVKTCDELVETPFLRVAKKHFWLNSNSKFWILKKSCLYRCQYMGSWGLFRTEIYGS